MLSVLSQQNQTIKIKSTSEGYERKVNTFDTLGSGTARTDTSARGQHLLVDVQPADCMDQIGLGR